MSVTNLKKHLLSVVEEVKSTNINITVTKRNVEVAKILPVMNQKQINHYYGFMKDQVTILCDDIENISFESEWSILND